MTGELARSLAGHDKGTLYLILEEQGSEVLLADGVTKRYAAPKKKNRKHIQPIHSGMSRTQLEELQKNPANADTVIKRFLKLYNEQNV